MQKANQLANALRSRDIGPASRVAILTKSQVDCALLVSAAMKIGAVCVPVNWRFSVEEIRFVLEAVGPGGVSVFVTDDVSTEDEAVQIYGLA